MAEPMQDHSDRRPYRVLHGAATTVVADPPGAGTPLSAVLPDGEALDLASGLRLAVRLGEALEAVHNTGRVHGDVRPERAEVAPDGTVKLLPAAPNAQRTPEYLAPEQLDGQPATERSDVYQLGIVLHRVLIGVLPTRDTLASLRRGRKGISASVGQILVQALDPKPEQRHRDVSEVVNALWVELNRLEERLAGRRTLARPVAALVGGLVVVALAVGWLAYPRPAPTPRPQPTVVRTVIAPPSAPTPPVPASPVEAELKVPAPREAPATPPLQTRSRAAAAQAVPEGRAESDSTPPLVQKPSRSPAQAARRPVTEDDPPDPGAIIDWLLESARGR